MGLVVACSAMVLLCSPGAFVPAPMSRGVAGVAVGGVAASASVWPAWAYDSDVMDSQMLLARVPGGKFTKEFGLVVVPPEDDGLSDAQIALLFVVVLVAFVAAIDVARILYNGLNPKAFNGTKNKGNSLTPLVKRLIEYGN